MDVLFPSMSLEFERLIFRMYFYIEVGGVINVYIIDT